MADTIKIKRGAKSRLTPLLYGEPAYISDEKELYIGGSDGSNEKITRNKEVDELTIKVEDLVAKNQNRVLSPKMFGDLEKESHNVVLQRCFDFYNENFDEYEYVDGLNEEYIIDSSTISLGTHLGVTFYGGTIRNFNFKLADGASNFTNLLTVNLVQDRGLHVDNCRFNGNRQHLGVDETNKVEDGGCHGILITKDSTFTLREFMQTEDIKVTNCHFEDIYSYGVCMEPLDCRFTLENNYFKTHGIASLLHCTTSIVKNNMIDVYDNSDMPTRPNVLHDVFVDEMELGGAYTGTHTKKVFIDNCRVVSHTSISHILYKVHQATQDGLVYTNVDIRNCEMSNAQGTTRVYEFFANEAHNYVNNVLLERCTANELIRMVNKDRNNATPHVSNCEIIDCFGSTLFGNILVDKLIYRNMKFKDGCHISKTNGLDFSINHIAIKDSEIFKCGWSGILLYETLRPSTFTLDNIIYWEKCSTRVFLLDPISFVVSNIKVLAESPGDIIAINNSDGGVVGMVNNIYANQNASWTYFLNFYTVSTTNKVVISNVVVNGTKFDIGGNSDHVVTVNINYLK